LRALVSPILEDPLAWDPQGVSSTATTRAPASRALWYRRSSLSSVRGKAAVSRMWWMPQSQAPDASQAVDCDPNLLHEPLLGNRVYGKSRGQSRKRGWQSQALPWSLDPPLTSACAGA
jgi:hypothetical protein